MKPVTILHTPRLFYDGAEGIAIVAVSVRIDPDEGLVLWGFRDGHAGVWAYRQVGHRRLEWLPDWEYRPAYREVVRKVERAWPVWRERKKHA